MSVFKPFSSRLVPLLVNDIDTDQIIPARFLKATDKLGLGERLFADWRCLENGAPNPDFILNKPGHAGAQILVAGANFGCGSSREHAAWALTSFGFRAVVSTSFADIFRNNALKNGLLPIQLEESAYSSLVELLKGSPDVQVDVDLENEQIRFPDESKHRFPIDAFSKHCLLNGIDELGYLQEFESQIAEYEKFHSK